MVPQEQGPLLLATCQVAAVLGIPQLSAQGLLPQAQWSEYCGSDEPAGFSSPHEGCGQEQVQGESGAGQTYQV